ncbi:TPA: pirin family protein [Klebsiella pneumoniae]|nr:pirin family protein [Klebsiella pneumoniae]
MNILRADPASAFEYGPFRIRRIRPGRIASGQNGSAFGAIGVIDHVNLAPGALIKMHEESNDEILSYIWRGSMMHEYSDGTRIALSPKKLMMMNAGKGVRHEESTPFVATELLRVYIRPRHADLKARVQFFDRPGGGDLNEWAFLAGPEGQNAPLDIRQDVIVYDINLEQGVSTDIPRHSGMAQWLYVMDGEIRIDDSVLAKGDAASSRDEALSEVTASRNTTLLCFLVNLDSPGIMDGLISGTE